MNVQISVTPLILNTGKQKINFLITLYTYRIFLMQISFFILILIKKRYITRIERLIADIFPITNRYSNNII